MTSFRLATRIVAIAALIGGAFGEAQSQIANSQGPKTPVEMAKAIAQTISANTLKAPGAPIAFESATSHDNFVEVRYVANDAAVFARLKSNVDQIRLDKASYYCNESRIAYLKQGVVMHEVIATSNNSDQIDFTFDRSSCDSLPKSKLADSKTLAEFARTVAKAENEALGQPSNSPFRLDGATAHQGIVDERFIVLDASARASTQANRGNITGVLTGYFCSKYRNFISQGLVFHHFFVLPDSSPVIDFTIDRSNC
ncbi:MAG TPA: hypothetical protein VNO18_06255 [Xanthobacteraceae bacterium]|jgi:hypothetical protein|nr:hypothetical protein [Xanthobacteraceae bacterium]